VGRGKKKSKQEGGGGGEGEEEEVEDSFDLVGFKSMTAGVRDAFFPSFFFICF